MLHDPGLERTTTGHGNVDELSLAEVRAVAAGEGAPVPTLDEAVTLLGGRTHLDVELKRSGVEREVLRSLARLPPGSWAVSSLDWSALRALRSLAPTAPLWPVARTVDDALYALAAELAAPTVAVRADAYTADVARRFIETGLKVMAWTVNSVSEAWRVRRLAAVALCTDQPAAMRRALNGSETAFDLEPTGSDRWLGQVGVGEPARLDCVLR